MEEFSLVQWLNVPFKENDKNIIIQSRNFDTLKNQIIVYLFQFASVSYNNQIYMLLDNTVQKQMYKLAIR